MTERQEDQRQAESIGNANLDRANHPLRSVSDSFLDRGANSLFGQPLIYRAVCEITRRIEACGASPELTHASSLACDLALALNPNGGQSVAYAQQHIRTVLCGPESRL